MPRRGFPVVVLCLAGVAGAQEPTRVLTPAADTCLLEGQPDFNLGAQEDYPAGTLGPTVGATRSRVLLRFDLAEALPAGAQLSEASLEIVVTRTPDGGGVPSRFGLHRMLRGWGEGMGKGGPPGGALASDGEATWQFRRMPGEAWASPGGAEGLDYVADPSSTERLDARGAYTFEFGSRQLAELQAWLEDPAANHGWMLRSQAEDEPLTARRIGSRENPDPAARPTLTVRYVLSPPLNPPVITGMERVEGGVRVVFTGEAGVRYTLESAAEVVGGGWGAVGASTTPVQAGLVELTDERDLADRRFYRVRANRPEEAGLAARSDAATGGTGRADARDSGLSNQGGQGEDR